MSKREQGKSENKMTPAPTPTIYEYKTPYQVSVQQFNKDIVGNARITRESKQPTAIPDKATGDSKKKPTKHMTLSYS